MARQHHFPEALAGFAEKLHWAEPEAAACEASSEAFDLPLLLDRFHHSVGGGWHGACSLWAQAYFNTLLIPAVCWLQAERRQPSRVGHIAGVFCPDTGAVLHFRLHRPEPPEQVLSGEGLGEAVQSHIARTIDGLRRATGLSARLLNESAERTAGWTLDQIEACHPAEARKARAHLARCGLCPSGAAGASRSQEAARRFCCLRFQVPGFGRCPAICPREHDGCGPSARGTGKVVVSRRSS